MYIYCPCNKFNTTHKIAAVLESHTSQNIGNDNIFKFKIHQLYDTDKITLYLTYTGQFYTFYIMHKLKSHFLYMLYDQFTIII